MSPLRFVGLGDSITAGYGDPMPDGTWRGWAALLASGLAPPGGVEFHNLANSGAQSHDVAAGQLPTALRLRPDLAAVIVGVNDALRGSFDVARFHGSFCSTVGGLRESGAVVLTARLPDPGRMLRLPRALARPLDRRIRAVNAVVDEVANRYHTVHFDGAGHPSTYDRRMWSVDRLHPSERGHRLLATGFADLLADVGWRVHRHPSPEPGHPEPNRWAQARWMTTHGSRWLLDRSTDLVPSLVGMAAVEWWYGRRAAQRLDAQIDAQVAAALHTTVAAAGRQWPVPPPKGMSPRRSIG
jgi:lysophospholipase L1-like esterase